MWNAFVQRRNGGGYDERSSLQLIELTDDDCKLLIAAGLKIQKGANPRDLYCFQSLPFYDGTPLQVLRLLEEVRSGARKMRKAESTLHEQETSKRQRQTGSFAGTNGMLPSWAQPTTDGDQFLREDNDQMKLPEMIKMTSSSGKRLSSPVKYGAAKYEEISSPVKPSSKTTTPVTRRGIRTSMKIDVVSVQEEPSSAVSSRKRKSEAGSTSTSPLAKLFSPTNIRTPSPGLKTRRSSVLKQFETPEQPTGNDTPQTIPAPPKRLSTTTTQYTITTTIASDEDEASDGLVDDAPEDEERACCDVKSIVEPIMDALQRTSTRFQNAWDEVRGLSSSLVLIPLDEEPRVHVADVRDDAVDLLVFEDDAAVDEVYSDHQDPVIDSWAKPVTSNGIKLRTRRKRQDNRRFCFPWRLW